MRIAQVAPPFESVPPTQYGGTERVVSNTARPSAVRAGHASCAPGARRNKAIRYPRRLNAPETDERQSDRLSESGRQRYQQAHRAPGSTQDDDAPTAGSRSGRARETAGPDQRQRAGEHNGPSPDD